MGGNKVGGSAIEASKIAAHCDLEMTGEYTCVSPERQNELTRRIQRRLRDAGGKKGKQKVPQSPVSISVPPPVEHALSIDRSRTIHNAPATS